MHTLKADLSLFEIMQSVNIAELVDESVLAQIGETVKQGVDIDDESREQWLERHDKAMELALQISDDKDFPWENSSNVIYPLITVGAMQFAARAYPAIVPSMNLVRCKVLGDDSGLYEAQMDPRTGQPAMNPQTGEPVAREIIAPGAKAAKADRVSRHMSYQLLDEIPNWVEDTDAALHYLAIAGCFFRKNLYSADLKRIESRWIPGNQLIVNMSAETLERAARISELFELHPYEIEEKVRRGEYFAGEKDVRDIVSNGGGEDEDSRDEEGLVELVEQHTRLDLDGDGYPEPYVVTFHRSTGHVFAVYKAFNENDIEGDVENVISIKHRVPYVKYEFIPNPANGFYGIGLGWLLGPLNEQVNTTINQLNDAATLQNTPMGFVGRGMRIKGGDFRFEPGEFKQVDVTGGNIRENLFQLQFAGPSPVLFQLLGMMIESARDISSVKDIMTGSMEQNIAPTTMMSLVEQGSKQFNSIFKRIHRSLKKELKLIFDINSRSLDQEKYFTFIDAQDVVGAEDYDPESLDIAPVTDPAMATDGKKQARMQGLMQASQMFPEMNREKLFAEFMEALETPDWKEWWQPPQPQEPPLDEQAKMIKAQADMLNAQTDQGEAMAGAQTDMLRAVSEIVERNSQTILNLAKAESEEEGRQMEAYIAQLRDLRTDIQDDQRRTQGMAGAPANAQGAQGANGGGTV